MYMHNAGCYRVTPEKLSTSFIGNHLTFQPAGLNITKLSRTIMVKINGVIVCCFVDVFKLHKIQCCIFHFPIVPFTRNSIVRLFTQGS